MENDPYRAEAGLELDAVIHARLMKQTVPAGSCPAYSSDDQLAKEVLARLDTSATRWTGQKCLLIRLLWPFVDWPCCGWRKPRPV